MPYLLNVHPVDIHDVEAKNNGKKMEMKSRKHQKNYTLCLKYSMIDDIFFHLIS